MQRVTSAFWSVVDFPFRVTSYGLIQLYRYTLSAFTGRTCRHAPSCSEYTRDAIWRHGFWPGGWMGLARIVRCRPGGTHGYDPVPEALPADAAWYAPWSYGHWKRVEVPNGVQAMKRIDQARRVVMAGPDDVRAAFDSEAAMLRWLPPDGMTGKFEHFDPRSGGGYRMLLIYQDAAQPGKTGESIDAVDVRYLEVDSRRIVQAVDFDSDDPAFSGTMRMTWSFSQVPEGTEVLVTAEDVPIGISPEDHQQGLESSLENLAAFVERRSN